jgi:tetratricopeptide (TPR) repeat protein
MLELEAIFRLALRFDRSSRQAVFGLSRVLLAQGRYQDARDAFREIRETNVTVFDNFWIGNLEAWNGDRAQALERWLAAGNSPSYRSSLAITLFGQSNWDDYHPERWDDAIFVLETTLAEPNVKPAERVTLGLRLAEMYQHVGKLGESIAALNDVLTIDSHNARGRGTLAWLYMALNRDEEALAQASSALENGPNWRADYVRGIILLKRCQLHDAERAFTEGLKEKPDEYRFYWQLIGLGDTYWEQSMPDLAFAQWTLYLKFQPNDTQLRARLDKAVRNELTRHCNSS